LNGSITRSAMTALRQSPREASHKTGKCQTRYGIHRIPADVRGCRRDIAEMLRSCLMILDRWGVAEILSRSKEPGQSYKPGNRANKTDKSSSVGSWTEWGNGSAERGCLVLADWNRWANPLVLLVHIKRCPKILQLERWEIRPNPYPIRQNSPRQTRVQSLTLVQGGNAPPAPLILPVDLILSWRCFA
jgi:hypothetical protein